MEKKRIKIGYTDFVNNIFKRNIESLLLREYDIEYSESPDFLFYSVYGTGRDHYRYKNCVKIFYSSEGVIPDFNECDYAIGCYPMQMENRYLTVPYIAPTKDILSRNITYDMVSQRKFCNFIFSNEDNGDGAILRKEFCKELMQYKHVDCPGHVLNNMQNAIEPRSGNWASGKLRFIRDYKFTIAFENVRFPGMVSEKILQPFLANSIPIYWGDTQVTKMYNSKAFINCNDCSSIKEMVEKVIRIDQDDDAYFSMLSESPISKSYNFEWKEQEMDFLRNIIERGNNEFKKDPLNWDSGIKAAYELNCIQNLFFYKCYKKKEVIKDKVKKEINKSVKKFYKE